MNQNELKHRTRQFALRTMKLTEALPDHFVGRTIGRQLVRSGTSVGANYRATCRARSRAEFVAKLGVVVEEADESLYWMELIVEGGLIKPALVQPLMQEANELVAIMTAAMMTAQARKARTKDKDHA